MDDTLAAGPGVDNVEEPTKAELQEQAAYLGLPKSGTKAEIMARVDSRVAGIADRAAAIGPDSYTVGSWKGLPNYQCNQCSFASLKKRTTIIHIAKTHAD